MKVSNDNCKNCDFFKESTDEHRSNMIQNDICPKREDGACETGTCETKIYKGKNL